MKKLSIVVPVFNESATIERLVEKILMVTFPVEFELIIVDDHSKDGTFPLIQALEKRDATGRIRTFQNEVNHGKGYCVIRGFKEARGDIVMVQDADFEYNPEDIPKLLTPLLNGVAGTVYGSRFLGVTRPAGMALPNFIANRFLTGLTNVLYGCSLTDMETCYKLLPRDLLGHIRLSAKRFDFEPEITAKLLKKKVDIKEIPISYTGRTAHEGKKIKGRDFFIALKVLFLERFRP